MLRIVAWIVILTFLPIVFIVFLLTHFALLIWLALFVVVAGAIYGAVISRRPPTTGVGPS